MKVQRKAIVVTAGTVGVLLAGLGITVAVAAGSDPVPAAPAAELVTATATVTTTTTASPTTESTTVNPPFTPAAPTEEARQPVQQRPAQVDTEPMTTPEPAPTPTDDAGLPLNPPPPPPADPVEPPNGGSTPTTQA